MKYISIIGFLLLTSTFAVGQNIRTNTSTNSNGQVVQVQPKIMVVPDVREGEDMRNVLDKDINLRIALNVVKQAFDERGFTTIDFTARLKAAIGNSVMSSMNQSDFQTAIVEQSGADIYVATEVSRSACNGGTIARVLITAYYVGTGASLSNKVGSSPCFNTDDFGKLVQKAVEINMSEFLNVMQNKFQGIAENGQQIYLEVGFDQNSDYDMNSEMGEEGLPLSDLIELWMEKNAHKNQYSIQGVTDKKMIFDDIRIPLRDQGTDRNYTPRRFSLELVKFFREIGLTAVRQEDRNRIFFTIK